MSQPIVPASSELREPHGRDEDDPRRDDGPLARDRIVVRSLTESDAGPVARIDARIIGQRRDAYFERKFTEALHESGVRVSLVAESDGAVVGFVMARVDYGDFGQAEPTATIDTIGVDPDATGAHVGQALVSQLLVNLGALHVETVRTEVEWRETALLGFLSSLGFEPAQRLAFTLALDG